MKKIIPLLFVGFVFACSSKKNHPENIKHEVWNTVKTINRLWAITEDMDSLSLFIHDDMVLFSPDGKIYGKDKIINSYRDYSQYAETVSLKETEPLVLLHNRNKMAIVSYYCDLTIKTPDEEMQTFYCKDMYTLIFDKGKWIAVAQHYSFYSK